MRALIQRVTRAAVHVEGDLVAEIGQGLLILVCAMQGDSDRDAAALARKISKLRIFRDNAGKMNRSLTDTGGAALVVSQFTLAADTSRGNRPGFSTAAGPGEGERLYRLFVDCLKETADTVNTGRFGADMAVSSINDGPVTIWMET